MPLKLGRRLKGVGASQRQTGDCSVLTVQDGFGASCTQTLFSAPPIILKTASSSGGVGRRLTEASRVRTPAMDNSANPPNIHTIVKAQIVFLLSTLTEENFERNQQEIRSVSVPLHVLFVSYVVADGFSPSPRHAPLSSCPSNMVSTRTSISSAASSSNLPADSRMPPHQPPSTIQPLWLSASLPKKPNA